MTKPNLAMRLVSQLCIVIFATCCGCSKKESTPDPTPTPPTDFSIASSTINGKPAQSNNYDVSVKPLFQFSFPVPVDRTSAATAIALTETNGNNISTTTNFSNGDSVVNVLVAAPLQNLHKYTLSVTNTLKSTAGGKLSSAQTIGIFTSLDSSRKFPQISDDSLLTLVQKQTFKYFWDFGHPVSGLARERNTSGDLVTSGGSGFGIMALLVGVNRNFISRAEGLTRMKTIVDFLQAKADTFHGAFPHWLNGATGKTVPFSSLDDGADLVETSYLIQGLLTARQYFNGNSAGETALRNNINSIWKAVEWNWFTKSGENALYWHWSRNNGWAMNTQVKGWNEALITYVLAASSPAFSVSKTVYDNGWASNGGMKNGKSFYGISLPLGPDYGGPLFFSHYSFLGINPNGLTDAYSDCFAQNNAHAQINHKYCATNPNNFYGYSDSAWGLTASDIQNGYTASSPTNDVGVIAPTAALSSFPYTPVESMKALKFFYYVLGDKLWKDYGFIDAFSLKEAWFADSFLAIDQGPVIVMTENYRSGLLWQLFMSCPEVKTGLRNLGFSSPHI